MRFFNIPIQESMNFTIGQLIIYMKQIERIHDEEMHIHANAVGLAFGGEKSKGGEN